MSVEYTKPPPRRVRDRADMRIVVIGQELLLQTRIPPRGLVLACRAAMVLGLLVLCACGAVYHWTDGAPIASGWGIAGAIPLAGGLFITSLLYPDGHPRSWRTRSVDASVLADIVEPLRPHRSAPDGKNIDTVHEFPVMIWLVPDDQKMTLRAAAEHNEMLAAERERGLAECEDVLRRAAIEQERADVINRARSAPRQYDSP